MGIQNVPENVHDNDYVYALPLYRITCIDEDCIHQIDVQMSAACARPSSLQHIIYAKRKKIFVGDSQEMKKL